MFIKFNWILSILCVYDYFNTFNIFDRLCVVT